MNTVTVLAAVPLPEGIVNDIRTLLNYTLGFVGVVCAAKIVFVGARMAWDHKHNPGVESPTAAEFLAATVGWIIAGSSSFIVAGVLLNAGQAPQGNTAPGGTNIVDEIIIKERGFTMEYSEDENGGSGVGGRFE